MMVSNRSMVQTLMQLNDTEDRWTSGSTSLGNEDFVNKYLKDMKDDVVCVCFVQYADV